MHHRLVGATQQLGAQLHLDETGRLIVDQQIQVHLIAQLVARLKAADQDQQVVALVLHDAAFGRIQDLGRRGACGGQQPGA